MFKWLLALACVPAVMAQTVTVTVTVDGTPSEMEVPVSVLSGQVNEDLDIFWVLFAAVLVFLMQAGFALVEAGSVSIFNAKNILIKNISDATIGAIVFYIVGYAFALGEGNEFIGETGFALASDSIRLVGDGYNGVEYASFFFQYAFAATASTIVSGAVAERTMFRAYVCYSIVLVGFVYPVVVHWAWSGDGWASSFVANRGDRLFDTGVVDFAGSGVVHMVGGIAALVAAIVLGPRRGRFGPSGEVLPKPESSPVYVTLGTFILWFGWFGFNAGSTLAMSSGLSAVAAKVTVTTTLAAAASTLTSLTVAFLRTKQKALNDANNGVLAGLVSITAGCSVVEPEMAIVIGIVGGLVYQGSSILLLRLRIDDVVNASPVHGFCGVWGVIAASLFATERNYRTAYGQFDEDPICGLFYGCGGKLFAANLVFVLAVIAWVGGTSTLLFLLLKHVVGFRVDAETEKRGLDMVEHGGAAYGELRHPESLRKSTRTLELVPSNGAASASPVGAAAPKSDEVAANDGLPLAA